MIRKLSIDELPQFWSILTGEMSLVGPRPPFPHEVDQYEEWHKRRLSVTPGLTGLWQVSGITIPEPGIWTVKVTITPQPGETILLDAPVVIER